MGYSADQLPENDGIVVKTKKANSFTSQSVYDSIGHPLYKNNVDKESATNDQWQEKQKNELLRKTLEIQTK